MEIPHKSKQRFIKMMEGLNRSRNTIQSYDLDLTSLFRFLASRNLEFDEANINAYLDYCEKKNLSQNTIRRHTLAIRGLLRFMNEREKCNFKIDAIFPKARKEVTPFIEERTEALQSINEPWALAARIVEKTGLRGEEIVRLLSNQVQILESGKILIRGVREVDLEINDQALAEALMVHLKTVGERVFPFTKRLLEIKLKNFSDQIGIKLSLRGLRHLHAKHLYMQGDPLIKKKLGLQSDFSLKAYAKFKNPPVEEAPKQEEATPNPSSEVQT